MTKSPLLEISSPSLVALRDSRIDHENTDVDVGNVWHQSGKMLKAIAVALPKLFHGRFRSPATLLYGTYGTKHASLLDA